MPIRTETFIRRADREDLDTVVEWMEDPDFQRFLYGDPARSPKQIREQIIGMLGRTGSQTTPTSLYLIVDSSNGPIGMISLQNISWRNRSCSLDVYVGLKAQRNSINTGIAFFRAMEYAFDELNLNRVSAFIYAFNSPSWRFLERAGAVRELTLKEHVARDGKLYDMYGYGFLREEYDKFHEEFGRRFPNWTLSGMIEAMEREAGEAESGV